LDAALRGKYEIVGLPREAAASSEFDARISAEDVVVSLKFSRRGIAAPDFRLLHVPGAGLDGIDFETLPAGCMVCNVFEHEVPIAEFVCGAMLEWEIRMSAMRQAFSAASWSDLYRARVQHGELSGKTMALAGYGRIGQAIAKRAHAFDMRIIAIDPFATDTRGHADEIVRPEQLAGVLAQADYVVIACPLNDATRGMINAEQLANMKPDAVLINVSRAEIAVEQDLYDALSEQRIGGAVLDVWYQYPKGGDDQVAPCSLPFATLKNVFCTPHSSAWTRNLPQRRYRFIANNLERLMRDETLLNIVRKPPP
jgi:phosphoglycerate dehydrogenase-like enzyme